MSPGGRRRGRRRDVVGKGDFSLQAGERYLGGSQAASLTLIHPAKGSSLLRQTS